MTSEHRSSNSLTCLSVVPNLAVFGPSSIVLLYLYISSRRSPARPPGGRAVGLKRSESPTTRVRRLVSTPPHSLLLRCLSCALLAPLFRPVPGSYPLVFSSPAPSPFLTPSCLLPLSPVGLSTLDARPCGLAPGSPVLAPSPSPSPPPTIASPTATSRPSRQPIRPRRQPCSRPTGVVPERPFQCLCKAV